MIENVLSLFTWFDFPSHTLFIERKTLMPWRNLFCWAFCWVCRGKFGNSIFPHWRPDDTWYQGFRRMERFLHKKRGVVFQVPESEMYFYVFKCNSKKTLRSRYKWNLKEEKSVMLSAPLLNPPNYKEIGLKLMQWFVQRYR